MTMTLGAVRERLRNKREERGMSYQDLADRTGISKSTLQRYETASIKSLPLDKLGILAQALGVSPAYLMGWDESEPFSSEEEGLPNIIIQAFEGKTFSEEALQDIAAYIDFRYQRDQQTKTSS